MSSFFHIILPFKIVNAAIICSKCSKDVNNAFKLKKIALLADIFFRDLCLKVESEDENKLDEVDALDELYEVVSVEDETIVEALEEESEFLLDESEALVAAEQILCSRRKTSSRQFHQCKCGIVFSSLHRHNNHVRVKHEFIPETELFSCETCGKRFKIREYLLLHIRKQHSPAGGVNYLKQKNPCSICGKILSSITSLRNHEEKHVLDAQPTPLKPFSCDICGLSFRLKSYLYNHINNVHIRQKYPCQFCSRCFYKKYEIVDHLRLHTLEKPFFCDHEGCAKSFSRKKNLQIHQRIHNGLRPYACSICHKTFMHFIDRKRHLMKHSGERPHKCLVCNKGFLRKTECDAHVRSHARKI